MQQINFSGNTNSNALGNMSGGLANQLVSPLNPSNAQYRNINNKNQNESKFFNFLFAFFDEITKLHIRSFFFYFFQGIIVFIQLIAASWYSYLPNVWEKSNSVFSKIVVGINTILMLDTTNNPSNHPLPLMIIPFIWYLLIAIFLIAVYALFKNSGTITHNIAVFSSIVLQILFFIGFLPSFVSLGTILRFVPDKDALIILFFVLYLFVIAFNIVCIIMITHLINYCTNPTISFLTTFNGHHISNLLIFTGITMILNNMATVFDDWFYVVGIIVHILLMCYQFYNLLEFPLVRLWTIPVFASYYTATVITDILTIITIFSDSIPDLVRFIVPIIIFFVGWISYHFIFQTKIKNISNLLDANGISDEEKVHYFEGIQCKNLRQANVYLHIGLSLLKPAVLDSSFGLILAQRYGNYNLWMLAGSIAAFIPCNQPQLDECIEKLSKMYSKNIINRIHTKRLIKIQKNRALVSTGDIEDKISAMKMKTDECINTIKQFWYQISNNDDRVKNSSIGAITASINNTKRSWNEILSMYPNESQLAVGYSNFLIECLGKFEEGIVWKVKGGHLEKGFHADLDKFFQAFVVSMPKLWKNKMVDKFGNLSKGATLDVTSHTTTSTVTAQEKLEEDMEGGVLDQCADEMFLWPRLRMSLTRATTHYRPKGLTFFQLLKYFAFLVWVVLMIVTLTLYSSLFDRIHTKYHRINYLRDIRIGLSNMRTLIALDCAKYLNISDTDPPVPMYYNEDVYREFLPEKAVDETDIEFSYLQFPESFLDWTIKTLDSLNNLYHSFSESALNDEDMTVTLNSYLNKSIQRLLGNTQSSTSPKNAVLTVFYKYDDMMYHHDSSDPKATLSNPEWGKALLMHFSFSTECDSFVEDTVQQAREEGDLIKDNIKIYVIIDLVIVIAICLPLTYIPIILIAIDERRIFQALKSVNSEGAKAASQPLVKNSDQNIDYLSSQNAQSTNSTIICLAIVYTLLFIISIIMIAVAYVVLKGKTPFISDLIELLGYGCLRASYIRETFSTLVIIKTLLLLPLNPDGTLSILHIPPEASYFIMTRADLANKNHGYFFKGKDEKEGVETISKKLSDLHNKDDCNPPLDDKMMHPLYECASLDRLVSSLFLNSYTFLISDDSFSSSSFVNIFHLATGELYRKLAISDNLMTDLVSDTANQTEIIAIILIVVALILVLINIMISIIFEQTLIKNLKASLILIRHLPPPVVVETPKIVNILLVKKSEESEEISNDPKQIVFNTTEAPIICVGDGFIIETINKAFMRSFNFSVEQLVGKKLTSLIDKPIELEGEKTPQEQGAYRMYEKMNMMIEQEDTLKCNYPVLCACGDEEEVNTIVDVYPVYDKSNRISNFIIFIEDRKKTGKIRERLEETKSESTMLVKQLMPPGVSGFFAGKEDDFAFSAKNVTAVSVQIVQAINLISEEGSEKLSKIFAQIERIAKEHQPFIKVQSIFDSLIFVGGIFAQEGDNSHAQIGLNFAKDVKNELTSLIQVNNDGIPRFEIAVLTGGPLICTVEGEKHKSFQVIGKLIDDVIQLQAAAPPDSIIMAESTKLLLPREEKKIEDNADENQDEDNDELKQGIAVFDQNTYIL